MDYEIRPANRDDLKALYEIELLCFQHPWKEKDLIYELEENPVSNFWVIEINNQIVGFSDYWVTFDSATIAQIAIHPTFRRNHLASALMKDIIDDCYAKKVTSLTLEVRKGNEKAIGLYLKHGFEKIVVKPHYYTDGEDAIYMVRKVEL